MLVIDDDEHAIAAVVCLLRVANYEAVGINDSRTALEQARSTRPDIILCDVSMPGMDGYEVLRALKRDPQTAVIPFIFLSGRGEHADVRHGMGLGADDYLTKPFGSQELLESITARIERQRLIAGKLETLRQSLIHSVPHDFFTPLNTILGFSMLILDNLRAGEDVGPDDLQDTMESINDAGVQLHHIASNYVLLAELSAENGGMAASGAVVAALLSDVELGRVVRKCGMNAHRMPDLHYSFTPATVNAKPEHVQKIILELLGNAILGSRSGEWISVTGIADEGHYLIRVVDHGPGWSDEQVRNVEAIANLDNLHSTGSQVGLGLAISALLTRRCGGSISITRNLDRGTTVAVRIPLAG